MENIKNPVGYPKGLKWSEERKSKYYSSGLYEEQAARLSEIGRITTEEQREKQSLAKLGKPKTAEHVTAMSNTHKQRWERFAKVSKEFPDLDKTAVWAIVRQRYY